MNRQCSKCGGKVVIGQGKWVSDKGSLLPRYLFHKDASLCRGVYGIGCVSLTSPQGILAQINGILRKG